MLPISDVQTEQIRAALRDKQSRSDLHVLVVEDQPFLRRLFAEVLQGQCIIDEAASVADGWSKYLAKAHDLVFVDIGLSDGSGHDLAASIRQLEPSAHIVMATASHEAKDKAMAQQNRATGYLTKPFTKQNIQDYVAAYRLKHRAG